MKETAKQLVRRCPRLGGPVAFFYCTTCEANSQACGKIIDCWWETFDVLRYLEDTLSPEEFDRLTSAKPASKVSQLVDIIAQSQKRLAES
jgi:hypothetical protein